MTMRAVVIGTGYAGEGHTAALRAAGVNVVALCGRTPEATSRTAKRLEIPEVSFDWRKTLQELRPNIVAIATPAKPHLEMTEVAAGLGCHILCDKPLATNEKEAQMMLQAVNNAGVKHAYGSTSRYAPALEHTRTLLENGLLGEVHDIESVTHFNLPRLLTYHWVHQLSEGGGALNNALTHKLGQVLYLTKGKVRRAGGVARQVIMKAPVGRVLHDFRELFSSEAVVDEAQAEKGEWREVDADNAYTVTLELELPGGELLHALCHASFVTTSLHPDYLAVYGTKGTLHLSGPNAPDHIQHFDNARQTWQDIPVPEEVLRLRPQLEDFVQRDWNQLVLEFVADIKGEGNASYPTFYDGWVANDIIASVRQNAGLTAVRTL